MSTSTSSDHKVYDDLHQISDPNPDSESEWETESESDPKPDPEEEWETESESDTESSEASRKVHFLHTVIRRVFYMSSRADMGKGVQEIYAHGAAPSRAPP